MDEKSKDDDVVTLPTKRVDYTLGHLTSISLLQSGNIDTFVELFSLIIRSRFLRKEAEIRRERHLPEPLENRADYLKFISSALADAERARKGDRVAVEYEIRMKLGQHFQSKADFWLAEHFYNSCHEVINRAKFRDGRRLIRALERMGFIKERKGAFNEALGLLDEAFKLAEEYGLDMSDSVQQALYLVTHRICMTLGEQTLQEEEKEKVEDAEAVAMEALKFYHKALETANLAEAIESQAAAAAKIGKVMLSLKKYDEALTNFTEFLRLSEETGDRLGCCNGYLALASVYENMGDAESALAMLNRCQTTALENDLHTVLVPCCLAMGHVHTSSMRFREAAVKYDKAFEVLNKYKDQFEDYQSLNKLVRVLCGVGRAHVHYNEFVRTLTDTSPQGLAQLIAWKANGLTF